MTAQQTTWQEYTGSDEQIADLNNAKNGFLLRYSDSRDSDICHKDTQFFGNITRLRPETTHYWIIKPDPLREMKIRQSQTGQPVWVRTKDKLRAGGTVFRFNEKTHSVYVTTTPDWNIPNAEYSFTPWED